MVPPRRWLQLDQLSDGLPDRARGTQRLGTLNHTLLSLEALRRRQLPVLGIILNGPPHEDNPRTLEEFGQVPVIAHLPPLDPLSAENLALQWQRQALSATFERLLQSQNR